MTIHDPKITNINDFKLKKLLRGKEFAPDCCQEAYALGCESGVEYAKSTNPYKKMCEELAEALNTIKNYKCGDCDVLADQALSKFEKLKSEHE